jgi:segregation and condensation protein B
MLTTKLEAILFAVAKPLSIKQIAKQLAVSEEVIREAVVALQEKRNTEESGIHLIEQEEKIQLVSSPLHGEDVVLFLKQEDSGPLTRASLETLTIIAYRGPITKPEIEQIRGVNCSLILRNLLIRGLVEERDDIERLQPVYTISLELMKKMGLDSVASLPDYPSFHDNKQIDELLSQTRTEEVV